MIFVKFAVLKCIKRIIPAQSYIVIIKEAQTIMA
jgi:hypothetical protein